MLASAAIELELCRKMNGIGVLQRNQPSSRSVISVRVASVKTILPGVDFFSSQLTTREFILIPNQLDYACFPKRFGVKCRAIS